jgi:hypothetical protein
MTVDEDGTGTVRCDWLGRIQWRGRESFIPAGAVCQTRRVSDQHATLRGHIGRLRDALTTIDLRRIAEF